MSSTFRVLIGFAVGVAVGIGISAAITTNWSSPTTELRAAFNDEFLSREDGYPGLMAHYGLEFQSAPRPIPMLELESKYQQLVSGEVDVIEGFTTDASILELDLEANLDVLEDDKALFPPYKAAPLVRAATLRKYPDLEAILNQLAGRISDETMQVLNHEVEVIGRNVHEAARGFLETQGLLPPDAVPGDGMAGSVIIGSKNFTEQEILGEIMAILIEHRTDIRVVRRLNLGGTIICYNALRAGDIDLYPEYTGTGLTQILGRGAIRDPDETYETVRRAFRQEYDLEWLDEFGLNNTYTLLMLSERARELGIQTISDLASHVSRDQQ